MLQTYRKTTQKQHIKQVQVFWDVILHQLAKSHHHSEGLSVTSSSGSNIPVPSKH